MSVLLNILLVDDSESVNKYNRSLLESMNFTRIIKECNNGEKAVQFLKDNLEDEFFPDIIFLDLNMPQKNGFGVLEDYAQMVLNMYEGVKPVVVILSEYLVEDEDEELFQSYGQVEQFKKPMGKKEVEDLLEKYF